MSVEHLSDEQLQNYIENNLTTENSSIIQHLQSCPKCQASLKNYQLLFKNITNTETDLLSVNFNSKILSQIKEMKTIDEKSRLETIIYVLSGVAASLAALVYVMGSEVLLEKIRNFSLIDILPDFHMLSSVKNLMVQNESIVTILVFAGITILFFGLLDKLSSKLKIGKTSLLSI